MAEKVGSGPMSGYSHEQQNRMSTPLCGAFRPVKGNPLLVKPQLGSVKATAYDLPSDFDFTYGKKMERDGMTAGSVVENWAEHTGTKDQLPARDFKAMNKAAIMSGCLDAKAVRAYSKSNDIRVNLGGTAKGSPLPISENTTFGRGVRPSTPFNDLVSHGFRYDWVMQSPQAADLIEQRKKAKPKPTKASLLLADSAAERVAHPKSQQLGFPSTDELDTTLWKMAKFSNVQSKVTMS